MRRSRTDGVPVSVVDRVSLVLGTFNGAGPLTLAQVTARTGLPRSSVHRLLDQLANAGWLARADQTYEYGVKAYEAGQAALNQNRLLHGAIPTMRAFAQRTGFTVQVGVVDHGDTVYLAKVNGRISGPTPTRVGLRVPAHLTATGKAILANSAPSIEEIDLSELRRTDTGALVARTSLSITSVDRLRADLQLTLDRGAAFDRGELFPGIACVATSIGPPDHHYGNTAAVAVCAPVSSMDLRQMVGPVRVAAREIWDRCVSADLAKH